MERWDVPPLRNFLDIVLGDYFGVLLNSSVSVCGKIEVYEYRGPNSYNFYFESQMAKIM